MEKVCRSRACVPYPSLELIRLVIVFLLYTFILVVTNFGCEMRMVTATKKVSVDNLCSRHHKCLRHVRQDHRIPRGGGSTVKQSRWILTRQSSTPNNKNSSSSWNSKNFNPFRTFASIIHEARHHLAAAAVGRASAVLCCYPIETVKVRTDWYENNPTKQSKRKFVLNINIGEKLSPCTKRYPPLS